MPTRLAGALATLILAVALLLPAASARAGTAEMPALRVAVLEYGTVTWELDTIRRLGLDRENGYRLEVLPLAGSSATQVAFQGGEAETMVADWLWVARQRAAGRDYVFLPYSRAVGGLMVPAGSDAAGLPDLAGARIGIAGGPLDKSWLILRAHALDAHGLDLAAATEQVYAAPPLVMQKALGGEFDAALNYWHFQAKMGAAGMRTLIGVREAAAALGLDPETPLIGYVFRESFVAENPALFAGFARSSFAAKARLAEDDAAWESLRPRMNAADDAEFEALRAGFREGIPTARPVDRAAAARMFALMRRLGGRALTGDAETLPDGLFLDPPG